MDHYWFPYLATLAISVFPVLLLLLISLFAGQNTLNKRLLNVLLSFAVGGLLGDAFLHLIPHSREALIHGPSTVAAVKSVIHDAPFTIPGQTLWDPSSSDRTESSSTTSSFNTFQNPVDYFPTDEHPLDHHDHDHHDHSHGGHDHSHSHGGHDHSHSHGGHDHDHSADNKLGSLVLVGMLMFFILDKIVRANGGGHSHGDDQHQSGKHTHVNGQQNHHEHDHHETEAAADQWEEPTTPQGVRHRPALTESPAFLRDVVAASSSPVVARPFSWEDSTISNEPLTGEEFPEFTFTQPDASYEAPKVDTSAALLNLIADSFHNFTDGLAIAASFRASFEVGLTTTIACFIHEIPHEVGDFAILLKNGWSVRYAMAIQLCTAIPAFIGTFVGSEGYIIPTDWVLPITAGGFIYIATVHVIPELTEDSSFWKTLLQILAMILGVVLMIIIGQLEESSDPYLLLSYLPPSLLNLLTKIK